MDHGIITESSQASHLPWEILRVSQVASHTAFHIISHHFTPPLGLQDLQCWPGYEPASRPFRKHPWCLRGAWRPCKSYLQALQGLAGPCRALHTYHILAYFMIGRVSVPFTNGPESTQATSGNHSFSRAISCHVVPSYQTAIPQIEAHCSVLRNLRSVRSCLPNSGMVLTVLTIVALTFWENWENWENSTTQPHCRAKLERCINVVWIGSYCNLPTHTQTARERERERRTCLCM